jgi:osmoprotectant transport system ATP-binding protein
LSKLGWFAVPVRADLRSALLGARELNMPAIRLRGVAKRFGSRSALRDIDLDVAEGETVALIGPSGCGKTTCLRLINRLIEPNAGVVEVLGRDVSRVDASELRRGIGYVIQEGGLFAHYTVFENVGVVPSLLGWPAARIAARVEELLTMVGLPAADFAARYPRQLSGGQRQRVGIARALAAEPPIVLLDEPFGALDPVTREALQDEFLALSRRLEKTFVIVTHDVVEAVRLADRIVVLRDGSIVQQASPKELIRSPADEFVSLLLGRHRHQLALMTVALKDVLELGPSPPADSASAIELPADLSVWDALDRISLARADLVRVQTPQGPRAISRRTLLDTVA